MVKVYGIKILIDDKNDPYTEDTSIGLYNVTGERSEIRLIENYIETTDLWTSHLILRGGITSVSRGVDLSSGGNTSNPCSFNISLINTNNFYYDLLSKGTGLSLIGLPITLYMFNGINLDGEVIATGKIDNIDFTEGSFDISAKGNYEDRNCSLTEKAIDGEDSKPVHFGVFDGSYSQYAKLILDEKIANIIKVGDIQGITTGGNDLNTTSFYVHSTNPYWNTQGNTPTITISIAKTRTINNFTQFSNYLKDKYIRITKGANTGEIRRITGIVNVSAGSSDIDIGISAPYKDPIDLNVDTWCSIFEYKYSVASESFSIGGFGNVPYLFTYIDKFIDVTNTYFKANGNNLDLVLDYANGDIDSIKTTFCYKPSIAQGNSSTTAWKSFHNNETELKINNGVYGLTTYDPAYRRVVFLNSNDCVDNEITTYSTLYHDNPGGFSANNSNIIALIDVFAPKEIIGKSGAYILLSCSCRWEQTLRPEYEKHWRINIKSRRWYGDETYNSSTFVYTSTVIWNAIGGEVVDANIDNMIGSWCNRVDFNKYFIRGKDDYKIENDIVDDLIIRIEVYADTVNFGNASKVGININEIAIAFDDDIDLNGGFFTYLSGRKYSDTWGGRKTEDSIIASPLDILEHCLRLANWSESEDTPALGWGFEYATNPKIKLSGVGSFDNTDGSLDFVKNQVACIRGIYDYDKCNMLEIAKSICREFDLILWVDKDGYYCVESYTPLLSTPSETITLADIPEDARGSIKVTATEASNIYCEPEFKYNYNIGGEIYEGRIKINNASAETYSADYVEGITDNYTKESLWNQCHVLWKKCRVVNETPSEISELQWANGSDGYKIAVQRAKNFIAQMDYSRVEFTCLSSSVEGWEEAHRFNINFPHHTNGQVVECILEEITFDLQGDVATVRAVMLEYDNPYLDSEIQNSSNEEFETWQDNGLVQVITDNNIQEV